MSHNVSASSTESFHCKELGYCLTLQYIRGGKLWVLTCCEMHATVFDTTGDFGRDLEKYKQTANELSDKLTAGIICGCTRCYRLEKGVGKKNEFKRINLAPGAPGGELCNFKCIYCYHAKLPVSNKNVCDYNIYDVLCYIDKNIDDDEFHIDYNCGEITVSPLREKILALWNRKKWRGVILTNASIYCEEITELLRSGRVKLNCSLDAGTAETYYKIKGVDCFNKTVANLRKYAVLDGAVQLKYILLKDINYNEPDIREFIELCKELNAEVILSRDYFDCRPGLSVDEMQMFNLFNDLVLEYNLKLVTDRRVNIS